MPNPGVAVVTALSTPQITSDRKPTQHTTRHSQRGRTGRERPVVETDVNEGGPQLQPATDSVACVDAPHQHQTPPQQQDAVHRELRPLHGEGGQRRRRTAAPRHTAGCGPRPGRAPAADRPADAAPHDTSPANYNRTEERRTSCCQQLAPPPSDAAKMSPRISIGPEPVLACPVPACSGQPLPGERRFSFPLGNRICD
jgi:hypothetical protein